VNAKRSVSTTSGLTKTEPGLTSGAELPALSVPGSVSQPTQTSEMINKKGK
jgi:hypothetical protein